MFLGIGNENGLGFGEGGSFSVGSQEEGKHSVTLGSFCCPGNGDRESGEITPDSLLQLWR